MNKFIVFLVSATAMIAATATSAQQAAQTPLGKFGVWNAFTSVFEGGKICFVASQPEDSNYSQPISSRNPVFFMVTSAPAKNLVNETSTIIGYPFKPDSQVVIDVGGVKFAMFTRDDTAWMMPDGNQAGLVDAMMAGASMSVQGTSLRGTITNDTYSLSGITAALNAIALECAT